MRILRRRKKTRVPSFDKRQAPSSSVQPTLSSIVDASWLTLEPRIMFDGAAAATADTVATQQLAQHHAESSVSPDDATTNDTPPPAPTGEPQFNSSDQALFDALAAYDTSTARQEIVFLSPSLRDYHKLLDGISPNVEVFILDPARDGVEQMSEILAGRTGVDAVHVISHGNSGELQLGTGTLNVASMSSEYVDELATIRQALSAQADILLYGCDVAAGESGQAFVHALSQATGADIAASIDATGAANLGGDWDLEANVGLVEATAVAATAWEHVLADTDGDGLDNAIDVDDDNDGVLDATEFQSVNLNVVSSLAAGTHANQSGTGLRLADSTGQYFVDIYRHTTSSAGATNSFNATTGGIASTSSVENNEFIRLVYTTALSPVAWQLSRVTIADIDSLTAGANATSVRDGYVWSESGTWTPLGTGGASPAGAVVSVDTATADDVGIFVRNDPDGGNVIANIGQFTTVTAQDPTLSDVLVNMAGGIDNHNVQFDPNQPVTTMSLFVFNSGGSGMAWAFLPQMTVQVPVDTDGDTIANHLDLDSDNDGISDLYESTGGTGDALADTNNNGTVSLTEAIAAGATGDGDLDNDGLLDIFDANTAGVAGSVGNTPINTDGDSRADFLDLDSDNDGIPDTVEARPTPAYVANDGDVRNDDADGDGIIGLFDSSAGFGGNFIAPRNTDQLIGNNADALADYRDTDSDGDGVLDSAESGLSAVMTDANGDGIRDSVIPIATPAYSDPDGIVNNPQTLLTNQVGDTSEVGYREVNVAPLIDLNSPASPSDPNRNNAIVYTENGPPVNVAAPTADVSDLGQLDIISMSIVVAGRADGASEIVNIGGQNVPLNANANLTNVNVGGTLLNITYNAVSNTFSIVNAAGATTPIPQAVLDTLVLGVTYVNASENPTAGNRTLTFTATDLGGLTSPPAVATISVTPVNDAPVDGDETNSVTEDTTLTVPAASGLLANATDAEGDPLTISAFTVAGQPGPFTVGTPYALAGVGTLTVNANGSYSFTPAANYTGPGPVITYTVSDGNGGTNTSTLTLSMVPVNDAPVDGDETNSVTEDTTLTVPAASGLLANATDAEGDPLTISAFTVAGQPGPFTVGTPYALAGVGTLTVNANGSYSFTPAANYTGPGPVITYTVSDGNGGTNTSTLTLSMVPVNDAPVGVNDTIPVTEDTPVTQNVLGNDTDAEGDPLTIAAASIDLDGDGTADVLTLGTPTVITDGGGNPIGTITVAADGTVTFSPAPNYVGPIPPLTYTPSDGTTTGAPATVSFGPITPVNDAPVDGDETNSVTEDTTLTVPAASGLLANASDVEGDTLSISAATVDLDGNGSQDALPLGTPTAVTDNLGNPIGTLTVNANGSYSFTPAANYTGPGPVITYTVSDGNGGTNTSTLTLSMVPVNDAPVGVNDTIPVTEDTPVTQNVLGNDTDAEGDPLTIAAASIDLDGDGTADVLTLGTPTVITDGGGNPIGTITVAADGTVTFSPAPNYVGPIPPLTYTPSDGTTTGAPATVSFGPITPVNDAPVDGDETNSVTEDTTLTVPAASGLLANASDVEGDTLSISAATVDLDGNGSQDALPLGTPTAVTDNLGNPIGTLTVNANGSYSFTPAANYTGPGPVITYTVSDGNGGTNTSTLTLSMVPVNDAPVGVNDTIPVTEDTPVTQNVLGNDTDAEGDPLTIAAASIDLDGDGTADVLTLGTPTVITDGGGNPIGTITVAADGTVTFSPAPNYVGPIPPLTYTPSDGTTTGAPATVSFGPITPVNDAPVDGDETNSVTEDTTLTVPAASGLLANASDVEGDTLSISAATVDLDGNGSQDALPLGTPTAVTDNLGNPIGTLTVNANGSYSFTPAANYTGPGPVITYTVSDGNGGTNTSTLTLSMVPVNDAPVGVNDTIPVTEDTPVTQNVLGNDTDAEGDPLTIAAASIDLDGDGTADVLTLGTPTVITDGGGNPIGTITVAADGTVTFSPAPNYVGPIPPLTYTPSDGTTTGAPATVSFGPITPVNDAPVDGDETNSVTEDTTLTVPAASGLLANASDVEGDTLSISAATVDLDGNGSQDALPLGTPTAVTDNLGNPIGTLTVNANGSYSFTPAANYTGPGPVITYTVSDGNGGTNTSTLTLSMVPVNDAPVGVNDTIPVTEDTPVTQNVLGNDTDAEGDPLTIAAASIDLDGDGTADVLTLGTPTVITDGGGNPIGTITVAADGTVTFSPAPNYVGPIPPLTYTPSDGTTTGAPATVSFGPITPVNDAPVDGDETNSVTEDTTLTVPAASGLLANASDVEGDTLSISAATVDLDGNGSQDALPLGTPTAVTDNLGNPIGTLTVNANGSYSFTPAANYTGPGPVITYTVSDGNGGTNTSTLTLSMVPVNDAPVLFAPILAPNGELNQFRDAQSGFGIWREEPRRAEADRFIPERKDAWIYDRLTRAKWPHIGGFYMPTTIDDPDGVWGYDMTSGVWGYPMDRGLLNMELQQGNSSGVHQDSLHKPSAAEAQQGTEVSEQDRAMREVETRSDVTPQAEELQAAPNVHEHLAMSAGDQGIVMERVVTTLQPERSSAERLKINPTVSSVDEAPAEAKEDTSPELEAKEDLAVVTVAGLVAALKRWWWSS